jgi:hypothetical protein
MPYLAGYYVNDPFRFCRGGRSKHAQSDHRRFQHLNSPHALGELEWTLPECIQHVTERDVLRHDVSMRATSSCVSATGSFGKSIAPITLKMKDSIMIDLRGCFGSTSR